MLAANKIGFHFSFIFISWWCLSRSIGFHLCNPLGFLYFFFFFDPTRPVTHYAIFFLRFAKWLTERAIDTTVQLRLPLSVDNTNRFALQTATSLVWFTRLLFLQQSTLVNFNFINFFHGLFFLLSMLFLSARKNKCVFRYSHESLAFSLLKPFFPTLFQHICTSRSAATSSL